NKLHVIRVSGEVVSPAAPAPPWLRASIRRRRPLSPSFPEHLSLPYRQRAPALPAHARRVRALGRRLFLQADVAADEFAAAPPTTTICPGRRAMGLLRICQAATTLRSPFHAQ